MNGESCGTLFFVSHARWALALWMIPSAAADDVVVKSQLPLFELTLPAGYQPTIPREIPTRYVRSCDRDAWARVSVVVIDGGTLLLQPPSGITAGDVAPHIPLPPDATYAFSTLPWHDLDIGVLEYKAVVKDLPVIGLSTVLPLKGNSLTLMVYAPEPLEREMRHDFQAILLRISRVSSNWHTHAELGKIAALEKVGMAAAGLLALYPPAWLLFFRGDPLRFHWLRTAWLLVIAMLLFIPISSPGETTPFNNVIVNGVLPMSILLFTLRRIKLGVEA
jgi:hypothetical protein